EGGPVIGASAYLMKSPPVQMPDDKGRAVVEAFIRGESLPGSRGRAGGRPAARATRRARAPRARPTGGADGLRPARPGALGLTLTLVAVGRPLRGARGAPV